MAFFRIPSLAALAAAIGLFLPAVVSAQVAVDEDGALRAPTAEESKALADATGDALSQSDKGLSERRLPDGTVQVDLQGRFESLSVARVVNGQVVARCVTSPGEAADFLAPAQPSLATAEE
ncbi:MAG TPA: hypothetical protein VLS93_08595 [Anaeromyxobacteraceae bacterium]|nr:hypothetical protein [Anaeromyxobacteraceae bacterium]